MSSFCAQFRNKKTGEVHNFHCRDDFFGRHRYGYVLDIDGHKRVLNEDEMQQEYERLTEE